MYRHNEYHKFYFQSHETITSLPRLTNYVIDTLCKVSFYLILLFRDKSQKRILAAILILLYRTG